MEDAVHYTGEGVSLSVVYHCAEVDCGNGILNISNIDTGWSGHIHISTRARFPPPPTQTFPVSIVQDAGWPQVIL